MLLTFIAFEHSRTCILHLSRIEQNWNANQYAVCANPKSLAYASNLFFEYIFSEF